MVTRQSKNCVPEWPDKKINHQVFRSRRKSPSETSMEPYNQNPAFYTYQVPKNHGKLTSQRQTHSRTTHHSRFPIDHPKLSKPTILDCPQVLKSHPIHGEDPIPNTGRCISKKNPKPAGTIWNHVDPISSTKSDGSSTFCSGISTL